MDKETLSNYGWIVIAVLVLAVMIALATPFGNFVKDAVASTTDGLFGVNRNALGAVGITIDDQSLSESKEGETNNTTNNSSFRHDDEIAEGATYLTGAGYYESIDDYGEYRTYFGGATACDEFPAEVSRGDIYRYGNYEYCYGFGWCPSHEVWSTDFGQNYCDEIAIDGWAVKCINNVAEPGPILESINGEPVTNMSYTFYQGWMLDYHAIITTAPVIPSTITDMSYAFSCCSSLTGTIEINANANNNASCFDGVNFREQQITLTGTSTMLDTLGATGTSYCEEHNGYCQECN